ncbi:MarR family winged helix-turn-helix transcriptional regulator [Kiloniella majae]|uniref:MarR family winged helix-turn-helix transcriptional regulator n=1 Tax=Kiloniella majae TaxID=1938558 RepID=UPI000A277343|nr:MarR family transcriptional regulator [Kiloniella majae]
MDIPAKQALELWRGVMVTALQKGLPDLTSRQFTLLLHVYLKDQAHTVRGLAEELNMSKPAVTRALDRLGKYDFVRRKTDENDRRSILVQRTIKGSVYLREFGDMVEDYAEEV